MSRSRVFQVEHQGDTMILVLPGTDITFADEEVLTEVDEVLYRLRDTGANKLLVDFGQTAYFGSIILGSLLKMGTRLRDSGGRFALCNLSRNGREMLRIARFDTLWPIYDSRQAALEALLSPEAAAPGAE
jgi:anti-sigma B factor antagonist